MKASYVISIILTMVIVFSLPRLPPLGISGVDSLFSTVWLIFAILILGSHLRVVFNKKNKMTASKISKIKQEEYTKEKEYYY